MKKLLIVLGVLLVLIGTGVFVLYRTLDAETYKKQIIEATYQLTGRTMVVKGEVRLNLVPSPTIVMTNVEIKNKDGSHFPNVATIQRVDAAVKWGSLFENPLVVESIVLTGPAFYLERNKQGMPNWDFPYLMDRVATPSQDALIGQSILDVPPQFKNMTIQNGSFYYYSALSGSNYSLDKLSGDLQSDTLMGPFKFKGTVNWNDNKVQLNASTDKISASMSTNVSVAFSDPSSGAELAINGQVDNFLKEADASGQITCNIPKLSPFLKTAFDYRDLPASMERPVIGTASFVLTKVKADLKDIALRYGTAELENAISGALVFAFTETDARKTTLGGSLLVSQLDADALSAFLPKYGAINTALAGWARKTPIDWDLSLKANDLIYNGSVLKESTLRFAFKNQELTIQELKSTLPGGTTLSTSGVVRFQEDGPVYNMNLGVSGDQVKETILWAKMPASPYLDMSQIQKVRYKSTMLIRNTDVVFDNIDATIDDGSFKGTLAVSLTDKIPTAVAKATLKNVNLDTYFPYVKTEKSRTLDELYSDVFKTLRETDLLTDVNITAGVTGTDVTIRGIPVATLQYTGAIGKGAWTIVSLAIGQAATADLKYSGSIQKNENGLTLQDITYELSVPKASVFLDRAKIETPIKGVLTNVSIKGTAAGTPERLNIGATVAFSQATIKAQGDISMQKDAKTYDVQLDVSHPNFHQFMKLFDPEFDRLPYMMGTFTYKSGFKGTADEFALSDMDASIGNQRIRGNVSMKKGLAREVKANLDSALFNLEKIVPRKSLFRSLDSASKKVQFSDELLDFQALDGWDLDVTLKSDKMIFGDLGLDNATAHFTSKEKVLTVDYLKGANNNGNVSISGVLNASTAEPTINASIAADGVAMPADLVTLGLYRIKSGAASFKTQWNSRGNSIEDMIQALAATGSFQIQNGIVSGMDLTSFENQTKLAIQKGGDLDVLEKTLTRELTMGETPFDSLAGTFAVTNGTLRSSDTIVKMKEANTMCQLAFDMSNWTVLSSMALNFNAFQGYPPIPVVVQGNASTPETKPDVSPFIKYIEVSAREAMDAARQEQLAREQKQAQMDAAGRLSEAGILYKEASVVVQAAERVVALAPTPDAQNELVRAQDALAILDELTQKSAISPADLQKIQEQSKLAINRATAAQKGSVSVATGAIRDELNKLFDNGQKTMDHIHRVQRELQGVEVVEDAYRRGFEMYNILKQLNGFAQTSTDLGKMTLALDQGKRASAELQGAYDEIAKFDFENNGGATVAPANGVTGSIKRRSGI